MSTSKAVVVKAFGSYDVLSVQQFHVPHQNKNLIEVKVEYGGLNFADLYTRQGLIQDKKPPFVLGLECSGIVTAVGSQTSGFKVGERVVCYDYKGGMFRDLIRVTEDKCYNLPDFVTMEEGAAIFTNYLTAYFSIFELGDLKKYQDILILSCGGGVGCAATQLATTVEGVRIFGTTSPDKGEQVKLNGVDTVLTLDSTFKNKIQQVCPEGFDLILCNQGGEIFQILQQHLKPLGRIILLGANNLIQNDQKLSAFSLIKAWLTTKNISAESLIVNNRVVAGLHLGTLIEKESAKVKAALGHIFKLLKDKRIKPKIFETYPMDDIVKATKVLAERKNVGKVLISMKSKQRE